MLWLLLLPLVLAAMLRGGSRPPSPVAPRPSPDDDPVMLAATDPLEALVRYGTAEDAHRLIDEGYGDDLAGLGYRPDGG